MQSQAYEITFMGQAGTTLRGRGDPMAAGVLGDQTRSPSS
jgi:hypothetical protein